jgi:cell division protein FtsN
MADEGFREIQLSGKQLAALFMGAAVLLVVTFLCGVLVGRGVRAQKETAAATEALAPGASTAADPTAAATPPQAEAGAPAAQPPSTPPPSPPPEDLSYYAKLEGKPGAPAKSGQLAPAAKDPKAATASIEAKAAPAVAPVRPAPAPAPAAAAGEPPGEGYALRVAAYKGRAQADALAARLSTKGYSTWVVLLPDTTKGPGLYSVRVGKYKTSKEADAAKRRLQKEEKLKPSLITR